MFTLPPSVKIYFCTQPTDMRKSHDGLCALVRKEIGVDVFSSHLFVFLSKQGNRIKLLTWDHGGFVLWYKRLEKGRFKQPLIPDGKHSIILERAQLMMMLEGIEFRPTRRVHYWQPKSASKT